MAPAVRGCEPGACAGRGAATIGAVHDDPGDRADEPEAFDRKVAEVLDAEAEMLSEKSGRLLATGSVSIRRPAGVLNASLRPPRWWRPGIFRQWAVREDSATSSGVVPLGRTMDATSVLSEITLQLAVSVAWLDE
jgi:hypothetical protein